MSHISHAANDNRYVDNNVIRLVNLGPMAFLSNFNLTTSSGKHLEYINHVHIITLMYKVITSSRRSDVFSIDFDRSRDKKQRELTNNKNIKGKNHVKIYLKVYLVLLSIKKHELLVSATN